jgi:hypothetical protein
MEEYLKGGVGRSITREELGGVLLVRSREEY